MIWWGPPLSLLQLFAGGCDNFYCFIFMVLIFYFNYYFLLLFLLPVFDASIFDGSAAGSFVCFGSATMALHLTIYSLYMITLLSIAHTWVVNTKVLSYYELSSVVASCSNANGYIVSQT